MQEMVSIIIVAYNEINHIEKILSSLIGQTYPTFEILLYDNCSIDGTQGYVSEHFPSVKLIEGKTNLGYGGACNIAASLAIGKYIAFLNCDSFVHPNWLQPLVDLLENDASVGAAGAELVSSEDHRVVLSHGTGIHLSGVTYARDWGKEVISRQPFEIGGVSGGAFLVDRTLFMNLGGFEGSFFLYYEDTDLSLRLRMLGKRCVMVPESNVYHSVNLKFGYKKILYLERNRYLSLLSILSWQILLVMLPSMIIFELVSWGYCILRGSEGIKMKYLAWVDIARRRSWIRERRRCIKSGCINTRFFLDAFTVEFRIPYINSGFMISHSASFLGWLSAAPCLMLAKLIFPQ
jgi:GT2 family glycosyltransferase